MLVSVVEPSLQPWMARFLLAPGAKLFCVSASRGAPSCVLATRSESRCPASGLHSVCSSLSVPFSGSQACARRCRRCPRPCPRTRVCSSSTWRTSVSRAVQDLVAGLALTAWCCGVPCPGPHYATTLAEWRRRCLLVVPHTLRTRVPARCVLAWTLCSVTHCGCCSAAACCEQDVGASGPERAGRRRRKEARRARRPGKALSMPCVSVCEASVVRLSLSAW